MGLHVNKDPKDKGWVLHAFPGDTIRNDNGTVVAYYDEERKGWAVSIPGESKTLLLCEWQTKGDR